MEKMNVSGNFGEKFNHLEKGIPQIMVGIQTYYGPYHKFKLPPNVELLKKYSEDIHWQSNPVYYREHHIKSNQNGTYVISEASEKNKYSEGYLNCTGLIMIGVDKETGDNISVVTHQQSDSTTLADAEKFIRDLATTVKDFVQQCKPKTIDALIVGGNDNDKNNLTEYRESAQDIINIASPFLGFAPRMATGPKITNGKYDTNIYLDTENRRLHLFMPTQENARVYEDFALENIEIQKEKYTEVD